MGQTVELIGTGKWHRWLSTKRFATDQGLDFTSGPVELVMQSDVRMPEA